MSRSIWDDMKGMDGLCLLCENPLETDEHISSVTFKEITITMHGNYCKKCEGLSESDIRVKLIESEQRRLIQRALEP